MADHVIIFDTTLRDGEQSPGISLDVAEKLEIAEQLARLGVDYIEAGFPIASDGDFEAVQAIARSVRGPVICGLSRTARKDIDRCWEAIEDAERARIHVFIATSATHMEHKLRMTPDQVKAEAFAAVAHAKQYTDDVEFSPEDASRSDFDFMCEVLQQAVEAGATTLNIPDTVGYGVPEEYASRLREVRNVVPGDYVISTHCHDDLGMAVANSLAAVKAGARQVECTINGLGERAGNAAMEEVVMALRTRPDYFEGLDTNIRAEELARSSRIVSRLTGYPVQYNKAVVGRNAFAHESGIHQHGVLNERSTYEIMDPTAVGQGESQIVLGKHSGRHAFNDTLEKMGITIHGDALNAAFVRFKELADRKVQITDADLEAIVAEELGGSVERAFELAALEVRGGTTGVPSAKVVLTRDGDKVEASSEGDGMIDAACQAIKTATGVQGTLTDFNVSSVTKGVDALGDVIIQFESNGVTVSGRGVSTDVVEASARAFLNAVNKIVRLGGAVMARKIAREEGLFIGYSAGSCLQGLMQIAKSPLGKNSLNKDSLVVCIFHDHGSRYVGKIYNDQWMLERGFLDVKTFRDIVSGRGNQKLITLAPTNTVAEAVALMEKYDIENLPVMNDAGIIGSISQQGLFGKIFSNPDLKSQAVETVMEKAYPEVAYDTALERLSTLINKENGAVLAQDETGGYHIVTKYDVIRSLAK
jgi:2-isopropylmalate synthase